MSVESGAARAGLEPVGLADGDRARRRLGVDDHLDAGRGELLSSSAVELVPDEDRQRLGHAGAWSGSRGMLAPVVLSAVVDRGTHRVSSWALPVHAAAGAVGDDPQHLAAELVVVAAHPDRLDDDVSHGLRDRVHNASQQLVGDQRRQRREREHVGDEGDADHERHAHAQPPGRSSTM